MKRVKFGDKKFDDAISGGFPELSTTTISGPAGSGKTVFATQFLVNGIKQEGEVGLYITLETSKEAYLRSVTNFNFNLEALIMDRLFVLINIPFYEVSQLIDPSNPLKELINQMGVTRVVIDSIMPIAINFMNDIERKRGFLKLMSNIARWRTTTLIVSEDTKPTKVMILPSTAYGIEKLTDGWIHLYYQKGRGNTRNRYLEVIKMKGTSISSKALKFNIKKEGIVFE